MLDVCPDRGEESMPPKNRTASSNSLREGDVFNPFNQYYGVYVPDPVLAYRDLSPGSKLCYARLLRYGGRDNNCHPRVEELASTLGVAVRTAQKYLAELEASGFIRRVAPPEQKARRLPNDIKFLFHSAFARAPREWRKG